MKVLIVEDESLLARRLAAALGERGYAVDVAGDGERSDFLVSTETYDAVILDLGLPRIDGLTLLERWRGGGIAVPVLVLTARGSWSEKVRGIDGGADDYLGHDHPARRLRARVPIRSHEPRHVGDGQPQLLSARRGDLPVPGGTINIVRLGRSSDMSTLLSRGVGVVETDATHNVSTRRHQRRGHLLNTVQTCSSPRTHAGSNLAAESRLIGPSPHPLALDTVNY